MKNPTNQFWRLSSVTFAIMVLLCSIILQVNANDKLMNDGKRWWIVTIFWEAESPDNLLPQKYLETKN